MSWETIIGLEIHIQLATDSKIFSGSATAYGAEPNTQACNIDLGLPGVLPVLNEKALHMAIQFGLSVGAQVNLYSLFARKNYFYPDLPKGYQISQHNLPIVGPGAIDVTLDDNTTKTIGITRAHLEEDAGKSLHDILPGCSGIDLNRAGTPLLEIVSEPDMRSAKEAVAYLKTIHSLVRYLGICDGNMQEGSFRCDANVSVRPQGQTHLNTRAEIKNINSFRFVERAINFEVERHIDIMESNGQVVQETRLYNPDRDETRSMRSKEDANDYRYFTDPDLLPVIVTQDTVDHIKATLPELPWEKCARLQSDYQLNQYDATLLSADQSLANYFEAVIKQQPKLTPKRVANWIAGDLLAALNEAKIDINHSPISADALGELLLRIDDQTISNNIAKKVFADMWETGETADKIIEKKGLKQITDLGAIESIIKKIIEDNPMQYEQYRNGKDKLFGFFVGQTMKATQGKANPGQVNQLLKKLLDKD